MSAFDKWWDETDPRERTCEDAYRAALAHAAEICRRCGNAGYEEQCARAIEAEIRKIGRKP